jgi:TonB-linked SusC/RagA family outer membrane protein
MKFSLPKSLRMLPVLLLALFAGTATSFAADKAATVQKHTVSGIVRDAKTGKPISAAQIQALNNIASSTTDEKGQFVINVANLEEVLSVSAFDYAVREVALRGQKNIVVDMYPETFSSFFRSLEGVNGKERTTTTTASAKGINEFRLPQAISPDEFIHSELGGDVRSIYRSGNAGYGTSMFIRGLNSLNANAQPLFVVDGVVWNRSSEEVASLNGGYFSNPLTSIEVGDIESITVLKDGVSIYGSKASNGVILIKTNRGKSAVTKIDLNIMSGITQKPNSIPLMDAGQYRTYASEMIGTRALTKKEIAAFGFLKVDPSDPTYNTYHNSTNWADEVYQLGNTQSYAINVNGGDERALYYFSLGYTGNNGIVKTTNMSRIHTRINADIKLTPALTTKLNVAYTTIDRNLLDDGVNNRTSPTFLSMIKSPFLSPNTFTSSGTKTTDYDDADEFGIGNPAAIIQKSRNYSRQYRFNIGVTPKYEFSKYLYLTSQFDYNLDKNKESYFQPMLGTKEIYLDGYGYSYNKAANQVLRNVGFFNDTRLNFTKKIGLDHSLNAFLGWRYQNDYFESDFISAHNTGSDNNTAVLSSYSFPQTNGTNNLNRSISNYASANYNFRNKYFLNVAASLDGSSRFGLETKGGYSIFGHSWGLFPSINGAWLVSSEKFMKHFSGIDLLRFRGGYGITGNDGIEDYTTKAYFQTVRYIDYANGIVLSNIENESLQWETTKRLNAGIDLGVLNNTLMLSADVYSSRTSDLLTLKSLDATSGLDAYWNNGGEMSNKGFEVSATVKLLNTKAFQWEMNVNAGHYKNRIESLPEGDQILNLYGGSVLTRVGNSAGVFYGYKTKGVFATDAEASTANLHIVNANGSYSYFGAGDMIFDDYKQDNTIDLKDRQIIGDPNPDVYGSFSSKMSYRKITLNALFSYSYGNDVYNYLRSQLESGADMSNQTTSMLARWRTDGQVTRQPKAVYGDPMGNSRFSDRWIEDGSYLRLKTVSVSYKIPINNTFINGMDVWVAANNLWTLTNYLGIDPECSSGTSVLSQGIDAGLVPQTQSFFIGVKINL